MNNYKELIAEEQGVELWNEQNIDKCMYCEVDNTFSSYGVTLISKPYISIGIAKQDIGNKFFLITNEYEELSSMYGIYSNSPFRSDKVEINYCPMCGRKLGEWKEGLR